MVNDFPTTSTRPIAQGQRRSGPIRVLVIYNRADDVRTVETLLQQSDLRQYQITHINTFDEAVLALSTARYDVALLDYFIGNKLASEVFEAVNDNIKLPVIVLTGSDDENVAAMALEAGAFDFLDKQTLTAPSLVRSLDFAIKRFGIEVRLRENEEKMRRECERAEATQFSNTEFLGFVGNEIQTPLNAIIGFSQVIKDDTSDQGISSNYRGYAELINSSGKRVLNLIEDLLDLTRTQAETFEARKHRFNRFRTWAMDQSPPEANVAVHHENSIGRQQHFESAHSA